jgi:GntR family transcriptional regulator
VAVENDAVPPAEGAFRPVRRRGAARLAREGWGSGRSVWAAEAGERELVVDGVTVAFGPAPERIARVLGLADGAEVCVRRRRYVLDGRPVLVAVSYLDAALAAGTAIGRADTGPGGLYARLAELGAAPGRFREEVRSRMPTAEESALLALAAGTPVILVCRTAYTGGGRAVEVNEMTLDASAPILAYGFDA